jgi:hypothetical protein
VNKWPALSHAYSAIFEIGVVPTVGKKRLVDLISIGSKPISYDISLCGIGSEKVLSFGVWSLEFGVGGND